MSCCASSVILTGPGLSPQWRLGRAGLASWVGAGGAASHSGSRLSFGYLCPEARDLSQAAGAGAQLCTCPRFLPSSLRDLHPLCLPPW